MLQQEQKDFAVRHAQLSGAKRALLEQRLQGKLTNSSDVLTIARRSQQGPVFLSFAQQGLWFLDQQIAPSPLYNIPMALRFSGSLDTTTLQKSLNAIVERHEVLRTSFQMREGQPVQVIAPALTIPLSEVDLQALPEARQQAEVERLAAEEAQRPFDLTQGPLVRTAVLRVGAEEHLLLLTIHHIVFDGWSLGVFLQELITLYEAFSTDQPLSLPELPIQYADFALWQHEHLQGGVLAEHLAYWKQQLAGVPEGLALPTDRSRPTIPSSRGATYRALLPKELTENLKKLSLREDVTLYMLLVAAFQSLLHRYSGQDDIVLGTTSAGRTQAETEGLIGMFVTTLVLRSDLSGDPTFRELVGRVREVVLEAQAHQDVPFELLVKELQPERQVGQNPLFQVMLTFDPPQPVLPGGWTLTQMETGTGTSQFDLTLELADRPEGLGVHFEYSTDLFEEATIARMAGHWQTLLEGIVADPTRRLSELPLLTEMERHQQLVEWNATETEYPKDKCIHQLFEEQVERTPEAVAMVFEGSAVDLPGTKPAGQSVSASPAEAGRGA